MDIRRIAFILLYSLSVLPQTAEQLKVGYLSVSFNQDVSVSQEEILSLIPLRENDVLGVVQWDRFKQDIVDFLEIRGIKVESIDIDVNQRSGVASISIDIVVAPPVRVQEVNINVDHTAYARDLFHYFSSLKGATLNIIEVRSMMQQYINQVSQDGFYYARGNHLVGEGEGGAALVLNFQLGRRHQFHFVGNKTYSHQELLNTIRQEVRTKEDPLVEAEMVDAIVGFYEDFGIYESKIEVRRSEGRTKNGIPFVNSYIYIEEGHKIKINRVIYNGLVVLDQENLDELFDKTKTTLVSRSYFDRGFFDDFVSEIRNEYLRNGFIFVDVLRPSYRELPDGSYDIIYNVIEGTRNILEDIHIRNVPNDLRHEMVASLKNKKGMPLNILAIDEDIETVLNVAKKKGFYFAEIINLQERNVVKYSETLDTSEIDVSFRLGNRSFFGETQVSGNRKTKDIVITREASPYQGELLTLQKVQDIRNRLLALGLFSTVEITPVVVRVDEKEKANIVNLLVRVEERPFGFGEFIPGYRTDIGFKTGVSITYNNLKGINHIVSSTTQVNQRLNSAGFDVRRRREDRRMLEGFLELKYKIPYWFYGTVFASKWEFEAESSFSRKRFYNLDADILQIGPRVSKQVTQNIFASLRYQFESIRQFDATELSDNETYKLGSIVPSLVFDFRDNDVAPSKGAYFGLSWEFANDWLGPQTGNSVDINYSKLISRNRFYFPVGDWVMVLAASAGYQKNYVDSAGSDGERGAVGHIPNIKVFRLSGFDNVRGYGDDEVNRLDSGEDISDLRIQDEAYFVNYKFEPRYKIGDNFMVSFFIDAGSVYVNSFKPLSVKAAVGSGFKFLTPVGSLDFDYGIKLRRQTYGGGAVKDSFGRFHLTVGSF